jgi:hypothetical protein
MKLLSVGIRIDRLLAVLLLLQSSSCNYAKAAEHRPFVNPLGGETLEVIQDCRDTYGVVSVLDVKAPHGGIDGPPMHHHDAYTEKITVHEGTVYAEIYDYGNYNSSYWSWKYWTKTKVQANAGESLQFEQASVHRWWAEDEVEFRVEILPCHDGFHESIEMLAALKYHGLCDDTGMPNSLWHLAAGQELGGTILNGPVAFILSPVLKLMAWTSKGERVTQELYDFLEKYRQREIADGETRSNLSSPIEQGSEF